MGTEDLIFKQMNIIMNFIHTKFYDENILGVYEHDNLYEVVVIPTFEDICLNNPMINEFGIYNEINYRIRDLRFIYNATQHGYDELIIGLFTDNYIVNPRYEHMYLKLLRANREQIAAAAKTDTPAPALKIALMKIMRTSMNDGSAVVHFIKQITDAEKLALEGIITAIGDEGVFSQAKVASATGVSRVTMSNLVAKMEINGVAHVESFGPKGTYIKIIDDTLLRIRGE